MRRIITLTIGALLANILMMKTAIANECWRIERQLNEANYRLRQGGNASYMKIWQQSRDHNARELPKCLKRFNAGDPSINVARGRNSQYVGTRNEQPIKYQTDNPQLRQVIKTCNYWIQQHNEYASKNNRVMRNTACENVNRMRREIQSNQGKPQQEFKATRSLKECVKPNNKIDENVKLCMQGLKDPKWVED